MEFSRFDCDQHFSFKYFLKNNVVTKIFMILAYYFQIVHSHFTSKSYQKISSIQTKISREMFIDIMPINAIS